MKEIYIYNTDIEKCSKNKEKTDVIMNHTALHYIIDGYGYFNGVRLGKGDFFCAAQNEKVCYYPEKSNPWTYIYIDLCGDSMDEVIKEYDFRGNNAFGKFEFLEEIFAIHDLFIKHNQKNNVNKPFFNFLALTLLSLHNVEYKRERDLKITDIHVNKVKEFIEFNFNKKITVESIAKMLYLSPAYVRNIFYDKFLISPKQYLQNLRMKKAEELLKSTNYKVAEIAASVGYDDQLAFSKAFRRFFGASPTEYRKNNTARD